jgi:hypothetical protein
MGGVVREGGLVSDAQDLSVLLGFQPEGAQPDRDAPVVLAHPLGWLVGWVQDTDEQDAREVVWGFLGLGGGDALSVLAPATTLDTLGGRGTELYGAVMPQGLALAYFTEEDRSAISVAWIDLSGDEPAVRANTLPLEDADERAPLSLVALKGALGIVWSTKDGQTRLSRVAWQGREFLALPTYLAEGGLPWGVAPLSDLGFVAGASAATHDLELDQGLRLGVFDAEGVPACIQAPP